MLLTMVLFAPIYYLDFIHRPPIEASSIGRNQQSRFHLMTREEPSLETLWLQNIRTMDKVQIIDRSKRSLTYNKEIPFLIINILNINTVFILILTLGNPGLFSL
jgi:hypothetical protein